MGLTQQNGQKLLFSLVLILGVALLRRLLNCATRRLVRGEGARKVRFWSKQGTSQFGAVVIIIGLASIWFDNPQRMATAAGLLTAGLAFALQKVVTAVAGYFVILRGKTFTVGDRIMMGSVRGDVVALGFIQTTIMEMGNPPEESDGGVATWVHSRQFTGRIVTVSNSKIFEEPVFNYTRDFPYIWEELRIPIKYEADRETAEKIVLEAAGRHALGAGAIQAQALRLIGERYHVAPVELGPKVYYRLTDNWLELTVRFLVHTHRVRETKSDISRDLLAGFDAAKIGIASATFDIVGFPSLTLNRIN